ncbi:HTTM domain-containing protein [Haloarchaeobius sp. DFWS5]|uniref:HTTM domain-containing protein n=1 Tax=Haloarchaeobius sp. DFWS5 TaxID=3446114 RepID=UPI003EBD566B
MAEQRLPTDADARSRLWHAVSSRFAVDARALAALRVALGCLLLLDLSLRAQDLAAFYTDAGVMPRAVLRAQFPAFASISLHTLSGELWFQGCLFVAAALAAVALLTGYRTRLATAVSLVLLISLHARNPVLLNGGDSLLRRLLFWSLFLPLGRYWSVDARRRAATAGEARVLDTWVVSVATAGLLVQVTTVYVVNALFKFRGAAWPSGEAVRIVMQLDELTYLLGDVLAGQTLLLTAATYAWLGAVVLSPLLILATGWTRAGLATVLAVMHLGMALTLRLGPFPLVSFAALLVFLPPGVWDQLSARLSAATDSIPVRSSEATDGTATADTTETTASRRDWRTVRGHDWTRIGSACLACLVLFIVFWNAATLGYVDAPPAVESTLDPDEHSWDMFAPEPRQTGSWYVVSGQLETGARVDARHGGPVDWTRPADTASTYPTHRWLVYLSDLQRPGYAALRPAYADYVCGQWAAEHDRDLVSVRVTVVDERVILDGPHSTRRDDLGRYPCPGANATAQRQ